MRSVVAGVALAALSSIGNAASLEEWKSRSIYQVMIDRFARTDGSTDAECVDYEFCNGTWQGLINKLDYIQDMGFTAVQISPVVKNLEGETAVGEAYHGYWSTDLYAVNEHFGTADDLMKLSQELHDRDMFLMVDVVANNMAALLNGTPPASGPDVDYSKFNPFDKKEYFHSYCNVTEWDNATNYQDCWLYPYGVALADLDTESTTVVDMFGTWIKELVANYSIDGLRIDAAKHINDAFLPQFVANSGIFAFGEVLTGVVSDMCRYQTLGLLPGMPNYLEYYPLNVSLNGGSMIDLANNRSAASDTANSGCNDTLALGSFIENHDMPRFASQNSDIALAKNAMAYVILNDGIPTVYQGQEQHFNGGETPQNREALWTSKYDTDAELYKVAAALNKVRNAAIKSSNSSVSISKRQSTDGDQESKSFVNFKAENLFVDTNHLCMRKGPYDSQIVYCIVNHGSNGATYDLSIGGFLTGDEVVDVLACSSSSVDSSGNVTMHMSKGQPKAYALKSIVEDAGICDSFNNAAGVLGVNLSLGLSVAIGSIMAVLAW